MDTTTASAVLDGITLVAAIAWVVGLRFLVASAQSGKSNSDNAGFSDELPKNVVYGAAEIEGAAAGLSRKTAALLAQRSVRIEQRTDERIVFGPPAAQAATPAGMGAGAAAWTALPQQSTLPSSLVQGLSGWLSLRGQIRFTPLGANATRVDYALVLPRPRLLLLLGFGFQVLGAAAIVIGFVVIKTFVVGSREPAVRAQAVQMVQVVHFLWPPFLFGGLYRGPRKMIRSQFDTFIHNLPFLNS